MRESDSELSAFTRCPPLTSTQDNLSEELHFREAYALSQSKCDNDEPLQAIIAPYLPQKLSSSAMAAPAVSPSPDPISNPKSNPTPTPNPPFNPTPDSTLDYTLPRTQAAISSSSGPEEPPLKRLKPSDLPLTSTQRNSITSTLHTFKKRGEFDALRKSIYSRFVSSAPLKDSLTSALTAVVDSELDRNPNLLSKDRRQAAPLVEGVAERTGVYKRTEGNVDDLIREHLDAAGRKLREIRRADVGERMAAEEEARGGKSDDAYAAESEARRLERARKREEEAARQRELEEEERRKREEERRKREEERRRAREEAERKERERLELEEKRQQEREEERQREADKRREWEREMQERRERKARQDAQWERERIEREEKERAKREKEREKEAEEAAMRELIEEGKRLAAKASRSEPIDDLPRRKGSDAKAVPVKESALEAIMRKEKLEREARALKSQDPSETPEAGTPRRREDRRDSNTAHERGSRPAHLRPSADGSQDASRHDEAEEYYERDHRSSARGGYYDSRHSRRHDDESSSSYYSRGRGASGGYRKYDDDYDEDRRRPSAYYGGDGGREREYDSYSHRSSNPRYGGASSSSEYHHPRRTSRDSDGGYYSSSSRRDYPYPSSSRPHHRDYGDYPHGSAPDRRPHAERQRETPTEIDRYMPSTSARANEQSMRTKIIDRSKIDEEKHGGRARERSRDRDRDRDKERDGDGHRDRDRERPRESRSRDGVGERRRRHEDRGYDRGKDRGERETERRRSRDRSARGRDGPDAERRASSSSRRRERVSSRRRTASGAASPETWMP